MSSRAGLRWAALATVLLVSTAVITCRGMKPHPERFAFDVSPPPGALLRIGSRAFGPVGGPNRPLMAISPDGTRVWTLSDDGELRSFDVDSAAPLWRVGAHFDTVTGSDVSPTERIETLWSVLLGGYREPPRDLAVSPDGRRVATCAGAMIRVFDAATGECIAERHTQRSVDALAWSMDGRRLYRNDERIVLAWDVDSDDEIASAPFPSPYLSVVPVPDGSVRVVVEDASLPGDRTFRLDGIALRPLAPESPLPRGWDRARVFDTSGRELAVRYAPTLGTSKPTWTWGWWSETTGAIEESFTTDGTTFNEVISVPGRSFVKPGLRAADLIRLAHNVSTAITAGRHAGTDVSAEGSRVAYVAHGRAIIHDIRADRRLHADEVILDPRTFRLYPDGRRMLVAADDASLAEIDLATGRVLRRFDVGGGIADLVIAPSGRSAAGGVPGSNFCVDLISGAVIRRFDTYGLIFRGDHAIGFGFDGTNASVLDVTDGSVVHLDRSAGGFMGSTWFSSDGTRICAEGSAGRFVWDTTTGRVLDVPTPEPPRLRLEFEDRGRVLRIHDVARVGVRPAASEFSAPTIDVVPQDPLRVAADHVVTQRDALLAIGWAIDGDVRIVVLSADDGRTLATFPTDTDATGGGGGSARDAANRTGSVHRLEFTSDRRRLVSGHADGTILVWDLEAALAAKR